MDQKKSVSEKHVHIQDYEPVSSDVLNALPVGLVRRQMMVPLAKVDGRLIVAVAQKEPGQVKPEGLQMVAHCPIEMVWAPVNEIEAFIEMHYPGKNSELIPVVADIPEAETSFRGATQIPGPLERLIKSAILNRATEILIQREGSNIHSRQRIRGVLMSDLKTPLNMQDLLTIFDHIGKIGELKIGNGMKWGEGRLDFKVGEDIYACELLLSETSEFGLVTIRMFSQGEKEFAPGSWGMGPQQAQFLESFLSRSMGLILFCGTDSNDLTANIHACAKSLATAERHLIVVEKSRDSWFPGMEQLVSYNDPELFTKYLLRAFRHRPDVVVADALERKDQFEICMNESLKGRLVLARMYALDAPDAIRQILGMGLEPYMIGSSLVGIVVQRTLRLNCPHCQEKDAVSRDRIKELGIPITMQPAAFFHGKGCEKCFKTGFDRETSIFEVLEISDDLRQRLDLNMKPEAIRAAVKSSGMMTLHQVALHKAINGQTSLAEVLRVTR